MYKKRCPAENTLYPYFSSQFQGRKDKGRKSSQDCICKPISHTAGDSFSSF